MFSVQVFEPTQTDVRSFVEPGTGVVWFQASSLSEPLEFTTPGRYLPTVLEDHEYKEVKQEFGRPSLYVREEGVYMLIMQSKSPYANHFKRWLAYTVLPSIRKTGSFGDTPNHESGGSEFLQVINGAIACGIEPERMVDLYHRFNGNKQSKDKATKPVSKQNAKPSKKALKPATDKTLARRIIKAASSLQNPTATQILEACDIPLNKTNQMKVVSVLKEFGWNNTRRRINGENLRIWQPN